MSKETEIYKQIIQDFCEETKQYKNKNGIPGLFLPHVLKTYYTANKKCFYVGRDTNGWGLFDDLLSSFESENIEQYIENGWPENPDDFLEYANNNAYGFWTFVSKLHLKINGVNDVKAINLNLNDYCKNILTGLGYGNLNSIETISSLMNRDIWNSIDPLIYHDIKQKSERFDKLKYIIEIYKPDYIFIFNWKANEDLAFSDLNPEWLKYEYVPNICSTYKIKNVNTKIIWTIHPNSLRFKRLKVDELIQIIYDRL